ncbi:MAG: hypothetical protein WBD22_04745 [Pyrinomonadaceae bacterium]
MILALTEIGFELSDEDKEQILQGVDFVQINEDPSIFAPDGIDSFEMAESRMIVLENFHIASLQDIIAGKKAAGREKDLVDLPLLEDFRIEYERFNRKEPRTVMEIALEKVSRKEEE